VHAGLGGLVCQDQPEPSSSAPSLTRMVPGLVLHYLIALSMALVYCRTSRRWPLLWRRPLQYGAAYGLLLYAIMNYVVVPLSAAGPGSKDPLWVTLSIAVHAFLIGVPIARFVRRAMWNQQGHQPVFSE
jgi:uncharacterized membrane protein YagU involved in acid resistance